MCKCFYNEQQIPTLINSLEKYKCFNSQDFLYYNLLTFYNFEIRKLSRFKKKIRHSSSRNCFSLFQNLYNTKRWQKCLKILLKATPSGKKFPEGIRHHKHKTSITTGTHSGLTPAFLVDYPLPWGCTAFAKFMTSTLYILH